LFFLTIIIIFIRYISNSDLEQDEVLEQTHSEGYALIDINAEWKQLIENATANAYLTDNNDKENDIIDDNSNEFELKPNRHGFYLDKDTITNLPVELLSRSNVLYLPSVDIIAYSFYDAITHFDIEPWESYSLTLTPQSYQSAMSPIFDWNDYYPRIFGAEYSLKIQDNLEDKVNEIIRANLILDRIIPGGHDLNPTFPLFNTVFKNEEIFDNFIKTNVNVELFNSNTTFKTENGCDSSIPKWIVLEYYPFFEDAVCTEVRFFLALVAHTDEGRIFYDLKTVSEPGCGEFFSFTE
jgi:hypothetical protein